MEDIWILISSKISWTDIYGLAKNNVIKLSERLWRDVFLYKYGANLPNGVNHELIYATDYITEKYTKVNTIINIAIRFEYLELLDVSLKRKLDLRYLHIMLSYKVLNFIVNKGYKLENIDLIFFRALTFEDFESMKLLLTLGANIKTANLLEFAIKYGSNALVRFLVDNGAYISDYIITITVKNQRYLLVPILLARSSVLNVSGSLALIEAIKLNNLDTVRVLLDYGADVNFLNSAPIINAIKYSSIGILALLVDRRATIPVHSLKLALINSNFKALYFFASYL